MAIHVQLDPDEFCVPLQHFELPWKNEGLLIKIIGTVNNFFFILALFFFFLTFVVTEARVGGCGRKREGKPQFLWTFPVFCE